MECIGLSIGSSSSRSWKMAKWKEKSGFRTWSILEIGKKTWKVGSESKSMEIKTGMKECGKTTWEMDKVHFGSTVAKRNSEESTLEITKTTKRMEEEQCSIPTKIGKLSS